MGLLSQATKVLSVPTVSPAKRKISSDKCLLMNIVISRTSVVNIVSTLHSFLISMGTEPKGQLYR